MIPRDYWQRIIGKGLLAKDYWQRISGKGFLVDPFLQKSLLLGIIQGLAEFLPISSSGHLVLAQNLFGLTEPEVFFDLILHLGTLTAIIFFYRTEVWGLFSELRCFKSPDRLRVYFKTRPIFRLGILIICGSIPTALIGFFFQDFLESLFSSLMAVGVSFSVTGLFLLITLLAPRTRYKTELEFPIWLALAIGAIQGAAIAPGLSRSGLTIALAIILGLERVVAARYSFLLSIPAIVGGLLISLPKAQNSSFPLEALVLGFASAAIIGYIALQILGILLRKNWFPVFTPWCFMASLVTIWLSYFLPHNLP
ncbi:MAG: undecaprenyl-diphosphate phosphatase [Deltaproteobacteria bacterium]|nr:undecaprenyl-diphosphate phosphatase [Deltaproteobacteria bacterium]